MACKFTVTPEIFEKIPGLRILLLTLKGVNQQDPKIQEECKQALVASWKACASQFSGPDAKYESVQAHPNLAAWRDCFKSLGIAVKKHVCSAESLTKRTTKADPVHIGALVDYYNSVSLGHLVPFGAFDMADLQDQTMSLRFTGPGDTFSALDGAGEESIPVGEAAYICEPHTVITRHINWRQSKFALVTEGSTEFCMMAELLPCIDQAKTDALCDDIRASCSAIFGAQVDLQIISQPGIYIY